MKYLIGQYELEKRRLRGDLIETFKILNDKEGTSVEALFLFSGTN
jgi:hypothetical protein